MKKRPCPHCGKPTTCARCMDCRRAATYKEPAFCSDCGVKLSRSNKSGLCRTHALHAGARKAREDPEFRARVSELGREAALANFFNPEARAKWTQSRALVGKKRTERYLGWCPPKYREAYKLLARRNDVNAAQARAEIERRIHEDAVARIAVTHASMAADYLRRLAPVYRKGDGWQLGTVTLTPAQLVDRAMRRGWQPEDWSVAA